MGVNIDVGRYEEVRMRFDGEGCPECPPGCC
jgi:hypothetical protein